MNRKRKRAINRRPLDKSFIPILLALSSHVLHESYGWGSKKRLPEFTDKLIDALKDLEEGRLEVATLIEELETLTGVKIQ